MPDGKAETIEQSIVSLIREVNISGDKIVGFGSDGASNMTGRHSGVATRMKNAIPELVSVHCRAHRVALAASQSVDGIPCLKKFEKQISSLFAYFHNSPLRSAGLREVQDILDDPKIGLKRVESTLTSNSSSKTRGAAAPRTRITCAYFLGSEEPSLKLSRLAKLQRTNSSPNSNCQRSKSAIFIPRNINSNINSLLRLRVGTHIIYIYIYISDERYIPEVEMKTI